MNCLPEVPSIATKKPSEQSCQWCQLDIRERLNYILNLKHIYKATTDSSTPRAYNCTSADLCHNYSQLTLESAASCKTFSLSLQTLNNIITTK